MQNFHHKRQRNSEISKPKKKKVLIWEYITLLMFDTSHFDRVTSILIVVASENEFTGRVGGLRIYPKAIQRKKEVLIESVVINV